MHVDRARQFGEGMQPEGHMRVSSAPGEGSRIDLTLPATSRASSASA